MTLARLGRLLLYLASFVGGRGALYAAPLLLANLLPAADYGAIEYALALASVAAGVAALGTASALPLALLGHDTPATARGIVAQHLLIATLGLGAALALPLAGAPLAWALAALFTATLALQGLACTHLKTLGRGNASVLMDAGLFGLMAAAVALAALAGSPHRLPGALAAAGVYGLLLLARYGVAEHRRAQAGEALAWRASLGAGLPLMLGGLVALLATTSGRLGMGLLAGPEATALYAVLARGAALPIVAHQLILVARFRHLFTLPAAALERATLQIVAGVALSALAFDLLAPWLGWLLGPRFVHAWSAHHRSARLIVAQTVLWSAIALNDLLCARHQVMPRVLPVTLAALGVLLLGGYLALQALGVGLAAFVAVHSVVMGVFYLAQCAALSRLGHAPWRTWATAAASTLALMALAWAWP